MLIIYLYYYFTNYMFVRDSKIIYIRLKLYYDSLYERFWNNISRYPRFFISSLVGSVLVILAPFVQSPKVPHYFASLLPFFYSFVHCNYGYDRSIIILEYK
jgi:hypothetical protein